MSKTMKYKFSILFMLMLVCFFMFGCKNETPVDDIYFNLDSGEQIVLIVGQTLEMKDYVEVKPSYATNKGYTLTSFNEDVVKIENNKLVALKADEAIIKVVSKDNPLKEDMMTVVVKASQEQMSAPLNLSYNQVSKSYSFDPVPYAASYTLKLNGEEIDLGNSTTFNLNQFSSSSADTLLIAQVKANAPEYSHALISSNYSKELKVYQAGEVDNLKVEGGAVKFNASKTGNVHNVFLNETLHAEKIADNILSLANLDLIYAGQVVSCGVEAVVPDSIKNQYGNNVQYYNSAVKRVNVSVLDIPVLSMSSSQITWSNISHASGYSILVDGNVCATVKDNFFDLQSLANYDALISVGTNHEISVIPVLGANSVSVAQTGGVSSLLVQRLAAPEISCLQSDLIWNEVDHSSVYAFSLNGESVDLSTSLDKTDFSMAAYAAGEYTVRITAVAQSGHDENGVYYLSSKQAVKEFSKHQAILANIQNYVLYLNNLNNESCEIWIDNVSNQYASEINNNKLNLNNIAFEAGSHTIYMKRNGDADNIESDMSRLSFTQLDVASDLAITNGIARVSRSSINANATIKLVTSGSKIEDIEVVGTSYAYNTTTEGDNYLPASLDYSTKVYVIGDGNTTFSYRENGELAVCSQVEFSVLESPDDFAVDKETAMLSFKATATQYKLIPSTSPAVTLGTNAYQIMLSSGSVAYQVQAIGDGSKTLNSKLSKIITVERLKTPTLSFNNSNNYISKNDPNSVLAVSEYEFKHNGELNTNYDFGNEAFVLADAAIGNVFTIKAIAVEGSNDKFYLNSGIHTLSLNYINNAVTMSLSGLNNVLEISPKGHSEQYDLVVEFTLYNGVKNYTLELSTKVDEATGKKVLSNNLEGEKEIVLPYTYSGKYLVQLIDSNHNAIIEDLNNEFSVRARFVKPSTGNDRLINSLYSDQNTFSLNRISAETEIMINTLNQVVLTTDHTQEFGLIGVVMVSDSLGYIVESNGSKQLVCSKYIQINGGEEKVVELSSSVSLKYTYSYNGAQKKSIYCIDLLDENYNSIIPNLGETCQFKVKYSFEHNAFVQNDHKTDLDSEFSAIKTIEIQPDSSLTRYGQTIRIQNVKETYTYINYYLLINDYKNPISLDATCVNEGEFIVFDVEYIYSKTPKAYIKDVNIVSVLTNNVDTTSEAPILSKKGGSISIAKTSSITLSSYKYNNNEDGLKNNSTVVKFNTYETTYDKEYIIEIYSAGEKVFDKYYVDSDATDSIISFRLDDIVKLETVSGMISISGYVVTSGVDDEVNMFNSATSNVLNINKLEVATNLSVLNSTLRFSSNALAVGYEVYEKTGVSYVKLNEQLLTTNSFSLAGISGQKQLVVKTISKTGNFTNSSYSEAITIGKVEAPEICVVEGKFRLTFSFDVLMLMSTGKVEVRPEIINGSKKISINLNDISMNGLNTVQAEPYLFLSYNGESLKSETLTLQLKITQTEAVDGVFYIDSNVVSINCHGLFAPSEIKKTTNENNSVEMISWKASDKNVLNGTELSVGYVFKIEYDDGIEPISYYSNDNDLKYYNEETKTYVSYDEYIVGTSAIFPAGYGLNPDGSLQVVFGAGTYKVSVQSVPLNNISGYNLCSSKYSAEYEFKIMKSSMLSVANGNVVWAGNVDADHYIVSIFAQSESEPLFVDKVYGTEYDFSNKSLDELTGVYKVVVKNISAKADVLNSANSEPLYVYRLPKANEVTVDDGYLILSTSAFFESVEIEFYDKSSGIVQPLDKFSNMQLQNNLNNLKVDGEKIADWSNFDDFDTINKTHKFSINLDSEVLKIFSGRDYSINVKLIGNTSEKLGLISSVKVMTLSSLTATKFKPNAVSVNLGVVQFKPDDNYASISKDGVYTPLINLKYSFNKTTSSEFWNSTAVYKVVITTTGGPTTIYAVDYYSLTTAITNGKIDASEYDLANGAYGLYAFVKYPYVQGGSTKNLYFHVFNENKIKLRDYDSIMHYSMKESMVDGENIFTCADTTTDIDLIGTINVDIYMMGGDSFADSDKTYGQLTAQTNVLKNFECYGNNTLTSYSGQVQFENLIPVVDGKAVDHPIYKIEIWPMNSDSDDAEKFYLYHTTEEDARTIASRFEGIDFNLDENKDKAQFVKVVINEKNSNLLFDISPLFAAGTYKVSIKTLAGLGDGSVDVDDYYVNSRSATIQTFQKLTDAEFVANNGVLQFKQSVVISDGKPVPYSDYEITLLDVNANKTNVFTVGAHTEGISIDESTSTVSYVLPEIYGGGKPYKIKVRALAKDNLILNGTYKQKDGEDVTFEFEKSLGISASSDAKIRIEDGMLKWKVLDLDNYKETIVLISFPDENNITKTIEFKVENLTKHVVDGVYQYHYHQFTDEEYPLQTAGSTKIKDKILYAGQTSPSTVVYTITAYTKGTTVGTKNIINSNLTSPFTTTRISSANVSDIKTFNGELKWNAIANAISYEILLNGDTDYSFKTTETSLSFLQEGNEINPGIYTIQIKAKGDKNISSMLSDETSNFVQLATVDIGSIEIQDNDIVWASVEYAEKYQILFEYTNIAGQKQTISKIETQPKFTAPSGIVGLFTIKIAAISEGESNQFNGKTVSFTSSTQAPMQVENFEFDPINSRFIIDVKGSNFLTGDKLSVWFDYVEYYSDGEKDAISTNVIINHLQEGSFVKLDEETYRYYHTINKMGRYLNISVQVLRSGSVPSNSVQITDIDLNLYAYGSGTEEDPYRIKNSEQLLNIEFFPTAHYILSSSISMKDVDVQARLEKHGAIISGEFKGVLDGDEYSISGFDVDDLAKTDTISLANSENFAFFGSLDGATIKNLKIGSENIQLILLNTFAKNVTNVIKLSVIATGAKNSIIDNVTVVNFKTLIQPSSNEQVLSEMYISGLIGNAENVNVSNSTINFTTQININFSTNVYVGGAIAKASNTNISSTSISFAVGSNKDNIMMYVGGAYAYFVGNTAQTTGIVSTDVNISFNNIKSMYSGGIAGFAEYIKIDDCETKGQYVRSGVNYELYAGGLVGSAQSAKITNSGTTIEFSLSVATIDNKYIGAIAGNITIVNNVASIIENCYMSSSYQLTTVVTTSQITVGIYGYKDSAVTITGCYKKES